MEGNELVAKLRVQRPGLSSLHIVDLIRRQAADLPDDVLNLSKPFAIDALLDPVHDCRRPTRL
jgi:hypothetical protein